MPALLTLIFAVLSGGFMVGVGGDTRRMRIILSCAIFFIAGIGYSMAWSDKLAVLFFGWQGAWIVVSFLFAIGSIFLGRRWFAKQPGG
jgi:hypothetical protein